jgi:hypothetical protein
MDDKLGDDALGVMKFATSQCIVQLAMFGSLGGEQFYDSMREGIEPSELPNTEKLIGAIKSIVEVMGGEGFGQEMVKAALAK